MKTKTITLYEAEKFSGIAADTLKRRLAKAGHVFKAREGIPLDKLFAVVTGDINAERLRLTRAEADAKEFENETERGNWIKTEDVRNFITSTFQPIRDWLLAMPSRYSARCNPANPPVAKLALEEAVDACLKECKEHKPEHLIEEK